MRFGTMTPRSRRNLAVRPRPLGDQGVRRGGFLDGFIKLTVGIAVLGVPIVAHLLGQRAAAISLLSQREQTESELRTSMFGNLIGPLVGKDTSLDPDRERLLAELLTLNFHEHFEFKPLLLHVDGQLAAAARKNPKKGSSAARTSLRSIARRVTDRQIASLAAEGGTVIQTHQLGMFSWWPASVEQGYKVSPLTFKEGPLTAADSAYSVEKWPTGRFEGDEFPVVSPDGRDRLFLSASDHDWDNQTIKVSVRFDNEVGTDPLKPDFTVTWFDFPLTDNTLLPDGNRFSVVLSEVSPQDREMVVKVVWFPPGYFTPRERPVNFRDLQKLLGRS